MKKQNARHLNIQKKTISSLTPSKIKGGTNAPTLNPLNSQCVCRTDAYLCLLSFPYCIE